MTKSEQNFNVVPNPSGEVSDLSDEVLGLNNKLRNLDRQKGNLFAPASH